MSSSPSLSPSSSTLARRVSWQEQLRRTDGKKALETANYEHFPIEEVRAITDNVLQTPPRFDFFRRRLEPQTEDCDVFLISQLAPLKYFVYAEETGIIACIHALTQERAYGMLIDLRERAEVPDEFFHHRIKAYLQCLLLAQIIRPDIFYINPSSDVSRLFNVISGKPLKAFPSMIQVLEAVGKETYPDFLSKTLVRRVLRQANYKKNVGMELHKLSESRNWVAAHRLVNGLGSLSRLSSVAQLLPEVYADIPKWVAWTPDINRIHLWENKILSPYKEALAPIFDLEGPDATGNQLQTFRQSSPGKFGAHAYRLPIKHGVNILHQLLTVFDKAVRIGVEAVELFITFCLKREKISWEAVEQVDTAMELCTSSQLRVLNDYACFNEGSGIFKNMQTIAEAIHVIRSHQKLAAVLGNIGDLVRRGPEVLSTAQVQLDKRLRSGRISETLAQHISALGQALLSASWLHDTWYEYVIEDLRKIPSEENVAMIIRLMKASPRELYPAFHSVITTRVCSMKPKDSEKTPSAEEYIILDIMEDQLWSTPLDRYRHSLRDVMLKEALKGFLLEDAVICIKQSQNEHDTYVRELRAIVAGEDSDLGCVKLANYLGPLCAVKGRNSAPVADCWRRLLMHMMRQRNPRLLNRLAEALTYQSWLDFSHNLTLLYGDKHFDPHGGLGFTQERFNKITMSKIGVARSMSTNTYSTGSTGERSRWF